MDSIPASQPSTKICRRCEKELSIGSFSRNIRESDGLTRYCRQCVKIRNTQLGQHTDRIRRTYGLSASAYTKMVKTQHGLCAICGETPTGSRLHVDHDHATGKVRALLCQRCNLALGSMRDSPALLRAAADYLEYHFSGRTPEIEAQEAEDELRRICDSLLPKE